MPARRLDPLAAPRYRIKQYAKLGDFPDRDHGTALAERPGELGLVVVDVLAELGPTRDDERQVPSPRRQEDAADASMGDHLLGLLQALENLLERHVVGRLAHTLRPPAGSILDDQILAEIGQGGEEAFERLMVGADSDEDQRMRPAYSARRSRSAAAGHCAKKRWASGYTSRPLTEIDSVRVRLST